MLPAPSPGDSSSISSATRVLRLGRGRRHRPSLRRDRAGRVGPDGQPAFHAFWSAEGGTVTTARERPGFEALVDLVTDRLRADPNLHVYHYAPYEPTAVKRLAGRYGTREEVVDRLLRGGVFVDLYRSVRQGVRPTVESYSIKRLEPLYGFEREVDLQDAGTSIVEFETWLELGQGEGAQRSRSDSNWAGTTSHTGLGRRRATRDGVPVQPQPSECRHELSPMGSCRRRELGHSACALSNASVDATRERARSARAVRVHVARSQSYVSSFPGRLRIIPRVGNVSASLREIAVEPARTARRRSRSPERAYARRRAKPASGAACHADVERLLDAQRHLWGSEAFPLSSAERVLLQTPRIAAARVR